MEAVIKHEQTGIQILTADQVVERVQTIREVSNRVMRDGTHYGTIPGVSKKTLFKAGAELLAATFQLSITYEITKADHPGGHREYTAQCILTHASGRELGTGIGMCTTQESKYAYRKGEPEPTGEIVPKEYWDLKKSKPNEAQEMLGGKGYFPKKIDGQWLVCRGSEDRVPNPDLPDVYNTVLKMAQKRALVAAVLNVTGMSDEYTQDVEDFVTSGYVSSAHVTDPDLSRRDPDLSDSEKPQPSKTQPPKPQPPKTQPDTQSKSRSKTESKPQVSLTDEDIDMIAKTVKAGDKIGAYVPVIVRTAFRDMKFPEDKMTSAGAYVALCLKLLMLVGVDASGEVSRFAENGLDKYVDFVAGVPGLNSVVDAIQQYEETGLCFIDQL